MKLLIVGSRSITDFDLSPYVPAEVDTVISGGAYGIDGLAKRYADQRRLSKYIVRPRYDLYGRAAMRYTLKRDDIPSLRLGYKKTVSKRYGFFWCR